MQQKLLVLEGFGKYFFIIKRVPFKFFINPFIQFFFQIGFDKCVDFEYICSEL